LFCDEAGGLFEVFAIDGVACGGVGDGGAEHVVEVVAWQSFVLVRGFEDGRDAVGVPFWAGCVEYCGESFAL